MACKMGEGTVDDALKALILVIKENIKARRFARYEWSLRCLRPWRRHPRCHRQVRDQRRGCCYLQASLLSARTLLCRSLLLTPAT